MMGRKTLYRQLLLVFMGFGALMTVVFLIVMRVSHETYHLEFDQTVNRNLAAQYVAANLLIREPPLTAHNFANSLRRITEINPDIDVYVLDRSGLMLASSTSSSPVVRDRVELGPIGQFLGGRAEYPLLGSDPTDPDGRKIFSVAPLAIPDCPAAYLYVVLHQRDRSGGAAGHLKTAYAVNEGVWVLLVAVALAAMGSLLFLRFLTRRLGVLQQDMERFHAGGFVEFPQIDRLGEPAQGDEIERLRYLFVQLAERIRTQMQELQRTDGMRRDLLANISHDLRTPLTTLHTHLETLSAKQLGEDEQRAYFAICERQSRRLIALVEQLLQLARLDAHQVRISPEPFQFADLAHDVVMKFGLAADRAGIVLRVQHPDDLPLVLGDIALLEHVLDNLLENALRHTPPGGAVTVRLEATARTARVEVHDTGCGIAPSEHGRVFERFYRGDRSRSSQSGHAGLGLAIVRGILELHGASVDFASESDAGTTFFFELTRADVNSAAPPVSRTPGVRATQSRLAPARPTFPDRRFQITRI